MGMGMDKREFSLVMEKKAHFRLFSARSHLKVISTDAIKIHAH